jgi:DNA-binding MarR family transcriptional regulator
MDEVIRVANFRAALRKFMRSNEMVAAKHGLTPQRYLLLLMIKGAPDGSQHSTVTELAARLQLAQHTVTELVTRAERSGLVRRQASTADRRITHVRLTAKGDRLLTASLGDLGADRRSLRDVVQSLELDRSTI